MVAGILAGQQQDMGGGYMMIQKITISMVLGLALLLLAMFSIFAAFHYCNDSKPEKAFLITVGVFAFAVAVISVIGILNC